MGKRPFFLTGANAKIILNNKSVAFATDISYSVTVRHATPRVLGKFEVEVIQPLSYDVQGTLTIIKYARGMKNYVASPPEDVNQLGNGIGSFSSGQNILTSALGLPSGGSFDGGAGDNFNPSRFFQSKMFDIEIRQKIAPQPEELTAFKAANLTIAAEKAFLAALQSANNVLNKDIGDTTTVVRLRDCRFTGLDFKLSKRGLPLVTLQFKARFADDDTSIASGSGVGQELS